MEGFHEEVNLRKSKWLLCYSYNPIRCKLDFDIENLNQNLALYSSRYKNFIIIGDFNVEENDSAISVFSYTYNLNSLVNPIQVGYFRGCSRMGGGKKTRPF